MLMMILVCKFRITEQPSGEQCRKKQQICAQYKKILLCGMMSSVNSRQIANPLKRINRNPERKETVFFCSKGSPGAGGRQKTGGILRSPEDRLDFNDNEYITHSYCYS